MCFDYFLWPVTSEDKYSYTLPPSLSFFWNSVWILALNMQGPSPTTNKQRSRCILLPRRVAQGPTHLDTQTLQNTFTTTRQLCWTTLAETDGQAPRTDFVSSLTCHLLAPPRTGFWAVTNPVPLGGTKEAAPNWELSRSPYLLGPGTGAESSHLRRVFDPIFDQHTTLV